MTFLKHRSWLAACLGLFLLSGCGTAPLSSGPSKLSPSMQEQGKGLSLSIQAPGDGPTAAWTKADIDLYRIILKDALGTEVSRVDLPQKVQTPQSTVRFSNLRHGETYTVTVLAMKDEQVLNSQSPSTESFNFTEAQDVEDQIFRRLSITLDSGTFSGTLTIPMTPQFFKDVFGQDSKYFDNSVKLEWKLIRQGGPGSYDGTYEIPATGYKDYRLSNLGYGYKYKLTLINHYKDKKNDKGSKTQSMTTKDFQPFADAMANPAYTLRSSDFK